MAEFVIVDSGNAQAITLGPPGSSPEPTAPAGSHTVTTPGAGTFTWPAGVGSIQVECWGGGAGGGGPASACHVGRRRWRCVLTIHRPGRAGHGLPVRRRRGRGRGAPGGAGTTGTAGGDTTWRSTVVVAKGGGAGASTTAGGTGGQASAGTGTVNFSGGNGAAAGAAGGGGGSSAGTAAAGNNGTTAGAAGAAPTGGVAGGVGTTAPGGAGAAGGGGGGGSNAGTGAGGAGGTGSSSSPGRGDNGWPSTSWRWSPWSRSRTPFTGTVRMRRSFGVSVSGGGSGVSEAQKTAGLDPCPAAYRSGRAIW